MRSTRSIRSCWRIARTLAQYGADEKIGAIVLTGSEKAFAAGADIKEMQPQGLCRRLYG
jgi:enoyl-CoA hydratase/carnithine racemase